MEESKQITFPHEPVEVSAQFARSAWFRKDRFGMFVHWGVYAVPGRGEWVHSTEELTVEDYQPFVDAFNPQDVGFTAWAKLAKEAGMQYAVFTAKHHDGYAMFDTAFSDYSSVAGPPGRDFVAEFLEAFRAEGLKVGLYFSLLDWAHPDFPAKDDPYHPLRNKDQEDPAAQDFGRYLDFLHGQIREICTNYGKLDILWFDFSYPGMAGETWKATELMDFVRKLQPDVLIDNRIEGSGPHYGSIVTEAPFPYAGDFASPEQLVPSEGILNLAGEPIPWEACITLNNHWGYHHSDDLYKEAKTVVRKLVEVVSKGGNLLLNVGPDAEGVIPEGSRNVLREVGTWVEANHASIYGAGASELPKPEWGRWTQKKGRLYAHVMEQPIGPLALDGLAPQEIKSIRLLSTGEEIPLVDSWVVAAFPDVAFVSFGEDASFTYPLPDPIDTVLEIELHPLP